jgi:hypothetical protein
MKKTIFFLSIFLLALHFCAIAQNYEWAHFMGGPDGGQASDIAVDQSGNVYTVGGFAVFPPNGAPVNPADFNPGPGNFTFNRTGSYISKLNSNGQFVWARSLPVTLVNNIQAGGTRIDAISLDSNGDIFITGICSGNADLDAGPGVFTLPEAGPLLGPYSVFIAKYSASGNFIWAKTFPGNGSNGVTHSLDAQNNIVVGISFLGTIDADPGPDTLSFVNIWGNTYSNLIIKLTPSGNLLWTKLIEGPTVEISALTTDVSGQIYVGGVFQIAYFNGQINPITFSAGLNDGYVLKLTTNGDEVWLKTFGGTSYDALTDLKTDTVGNIYITGTFQDTAWFNNTSDSLSVITSGNAPFVSNGLTAKLDSSGNFKWVKSFGNVDTTLSVGGRRIEIDSIGNVYTLASIKGEVTFNRGFENSIVSAVGDYSLAIVKHNNEGDLVRVQKADGDEFILGQGIALDNQANVYFTGNFRTFDNGQTVIGTGAIDMDPSQDTVRMVGFGNGQEHIFVAKWSQCSAGTTTLNETACTSFSWNNETYTQSGNYSKSLTTASGCDSISRLNLIVLNSSQASQNIQICSGETFSIGNQTFNQSGVYQSTLTAQNGCDSLVTTILTIDTLNSAIALNNNVFTVLNIPQNAQLQWLNCDDNFNSISGEINPTFTASSDGNYALETSSGNCRDTSNCLLFSSVGMHSIKSNQLKVYPIPTDETLNIESEQSNIPIRIFDAQGRLVFETTSTLKRLNIDSSELQNGLYFIQTKNTSQAFSIIHNR